MKRIFTFLLIVFAYLTASAEKVSELVAFQKAQQFMQGKQFMLKPAKARGLSSQSQTIGDRGYYVFNVADSAGFVIVADDDRMPEILGYSEHGTLNYEEAPDNVKWLLGYYEKVAQKFAANPQQAQMPKRSVRATINPFLPTEWGQEWPYNQQCPIVKGTRSVTGCVATAMAQVMNYCRWPKEATGSVPAYTTKSEKISMPQLDPITFNWDCMIGEETAVLSKYCGQATEMDYGAYESASYTGMVADALKNIFGYDKNVKYVSREDYSDEAWEDLIYDELAAKRAVIYDGQTNNSSGHAFIVHGYYNGFFIIDWGWEGQYDGYFVLTNLRGYDNMQHAVIGIEPPDGIINPTQRSEVEVLSMNPGNNGEYFWRQSDGNFPKVSASIRFLHHSEITPDVNVEIGLGLYDQMGNLLEVLAYEQHHFGGEDEYFSVLEYQLLKDQKDGIYYVLPISRMSGTSNWIIAVGADANYRIATIENDLLTLKLYCSFVQNNIYREFLGVKSIDGILYELFNNMDGQPQASVIPLKDGYSGNVYIPDDVTYNSRKYKVYEADPRAFQSCQDLVSLSTSMYEGPSIFDCPKLTNLELREGVTKYTNGHIVARWNLDKLEFPKSLVYAFDGIFYGSDKLKSVRFKNTEQFSFFWSPDWTDSMLALSDIYFHMSTPPTIQMDNTVKVNPNVTLHVPQGSLSAYKSSAWKDWKMVDDVLLEYKGDGKSISWGYCMDKGVTTAFWSPGASKNDIEFAMRVPSEMIAPYKDYKITSIQCYLGYITSKPEYVFITKRGTDYLKKIPVTTDDREVWATIPLDEPLVITGEELFVGVGRYGDFAYFPSNLNATEPDGFWLREQGTEKYGDGNKLDPGEWYQLAEMSPDLGCPLPIQFTIEGDNLPADLLLSAPVLSEGKIEVVVKNRAPEVVKSYVVHYEIDGAKTRRSGGHTGDKTITTNLIPNNFEIVVIELPADLKGLTHTVELSVAEVNGKPDAIPDNSFITYHFEQPAQTLYPQKVVVEEFTGTWCGWCPRGTVGLNLLNETFGNDIITIAVHGNPDGDEVMAIPEYEEILSKAVGFPSCIVNRGSVMDPYVGSSGEPFGIKSDIEKALEDKAPASISVQTKWSDDKKTKLEIITSTVIGNDDDNLPYQIGYVILEDGLTGSGSAWAQSNYYATETTNDPNLQPLTKLPAKIVGQKYDHVPVAAWEPYKGVQGTVPTSVEEGKEYEHVFTADVTNNTHIQNKDNLSVVVLLVDKNTGKYINAAKCKVGESSNPNPGPQTKTFEFRYEGKALEDNATVVINAEEDSFGFGEMNCETNPSGNPKNGLVLAALGDVKSGTAKLEILSNTLDPGLIQWCMGGECVPMNNITSLEKSFTANSDGICQVQFDANNLKSEGSLVAKLTATIGEETRVVNINFVYSKASPIDKVEFRYGGKPVENNATVTINAEEDSFGFGEMNCETNPSSNPKNGLVFVTPNGVQDGTAKLEILSNTLNPGMVQWCMGGECVPMNNKTEFEKTFKTDSEGLVLVQFDATNVRSEGMLEAKLTATIGGETRVVNIKFIYDKTNGISTIYSEDDNAVWYDMNGTRLENAPTRKGVYIRNGQKVIRQ